MKIQYFFMLSCALVMLFCFVGCIVALIVNEPRLGAWTFLGMFAGLAAFETSANIVGK